MSAQGFSASEGVDSNAMGMPDPPTPDWSSDDGAAREPERQSEPHGDLSPIYDRMDHLAQQNQALVEAFQSAASYGNGNGDGYDDEGDGGYVELTDEQAAQLDALAGLSPEELAELGLTPEDVADYQAEVGDELDELDDEYENGNGERGDDVSRLAEQIHERWQHGEDAQRAFEQREDDFNALRDSMPVLQNDAAARRIVGRAQELADAWQPGLVDRPEFVHLVQLVALASVGNRAITQQNAQQTQQQREIELESASGGGGMSTERARTEPDWGQRVVEAANRLHPRI